MALAVGLIATATALAVVLSLHNDRLPTRFELAATGSAIVGVSFAGIVAAARPRGCNRLLSPAQGRTGHADQRDPDLPCGQIRVVGHHVDCGRFASHVLTFGGRPVCAGCTGMELGGVVGIAAGLALAAGLFTFRRDWSAMTTVLAGTLSIAGTAVALGTRATPLGRVLASLALVGGGVVVAGVLASAGLVWGVFGLLAVIAAVGLRIEASRRDHDTVCAECIAGRATTSAGPAGARRPTG